MRKISLFALIVTLNLMSFECITAKNDKIIQTNEEMLNFSTSEVTEIQHWKDSDFNGFSFSLSDGSLWYAIGDSQPVYKLIKGQIIGIIPMSDEAAAKYSDRYQIFSARPYWLILHPDVNHLLIKIGHKRS